MVLNNRVCVVVVAVCKLHEGTRNSMKTATVVVLFRQFLYSRFFLISTLPLFFALNVGTIAHFSLTEFADFKTRISRIERELIR